VDLLPQSPEVGCRLLSVVAEIVSAQVPVWQQALVFALLLSELEEVLLSSVH